MDVNLRRLVMGIWNADNPPGPLACQGGQVMEFRLRNVGPLPTDVTITPDLAGAQTTWLAPEADGVEHFDCFGAEPMGWMFTVSLSGSGASVAYELYSSWVPGDPPNG